MSTTAWLLVLTLSRYSAATMVQVGPFRTEAACMTAAKAWLKLNEYQRTTFSMNAICVHNGI